jgi:hypothetical protein
MAQTGWYSNVFTGILTGFLLLGCTTHTQPLEMVIKEPVCSGCAIRSHWYKAISVGEVIGASSDSRDLRVILGNDDLRRAAEASLKIEGFLKDKDNDHDYVLHINVVRILGPLSGFAMNTEIEIRYILLDKRKNIMIDELIQTNNTVEVAESFIGIDRARATVQGAVTKNIRKFISLLYSKKINKSVT